MSINPAFEPMIMVLVGPSDAGKTSIGLAAGFPKLVSITTRPKRPGEREGVDYYFVTPEQAQKMHQEGELVEFCEYAGHMYGLTFKEIKSKLQQHPVVFTSMDARGIRQLVPVPEYGSIVRIVFVCADKETLRRRMQKRGLSEEEIQRRLDYFPRDIVNRYAGYAIYNADGKLEESARLLRAIAEDTSRGLQNKPGYFYADEDRPENCPQGHHLPMRGTRGPNICPTCAKIKLLGQ
ncbi:MAG: hypothetical protein H0Z39_03960 [Peptococcaceae bacterium]|nr:hypothetical protein [Peptococcaceae bacterium]